MEKEVVIIGGGPAGLSCGIYTARAKIPTLIIEKLLPGGTMLLTDRIENYPGFPEGITGPQLSEKMEKHYREFGGEILIDEAVDIDIKEKNVKLRSGNCVKGKVIVIATGGRKKKLGVEGEERLKGKGVSYCAICDGAFFKEKTVAVVGGGFSAIEEAIFLTKFVKMCYLIHRRDNFRAKGHIIDKLLSNPKIKPVLSSTVERIEGTDKVENIVIKDKKEGKVYDLKVDGIFISIGQIPNTEFLKGKIEMDENGYIITNENMETSIPGIFAIGDVRKKQLYQIITACGDGAIAGFFAEKFLNNN